jgi:glycosyltransferase involved in cell wall biosynthesis
VRIALVHYSAPPVVGGVESVLAQHARLMTRAGHAVRIVAGRAEQWDDRIPVVRLPLIDSRHPRVLALKAALDRGNVPAGFEVLVTEIAQDLRAAVSDVDVVIAHNVCSLAKNLALTAAFQQMQADRLRSLASLPRLILWHHDLAWTTPRYRAELHDGYPWDLLRADWGARHVVVSDLRHHELADLLHIPLASITVVPNGVDQTAFLKLADTTQALLDRLELDEAGPILLLPVRLTPRKNIELALRVLAALRLELPHAVLIIPGHLGAHNPANAEYFARLKAVRAELHLSNAAHFLAELSDEFLPDEVIADFYRLADALILPSREEGFGIPLIEAAFSRLPVFCTDIPPLQALGGEDVTYFSPDAEPAVVATAIASRLTGDPIYRFAARARLSYTWKQVYARHIAPLLEE